MTRRRSEELYIAAESMTLGKVIDELKGTIDPLLGLKLDTANEKRNYMAHHFWFTVTPQLFSVEGVEAATEELRNFRQHFMELDEEIKRITLEISSTLGVTDELLSSSLEEVVSGTADSIKKPKRPIKKTETIVAVHNAYISEKASQLIFESDDGLYWTPCDVGLGWSYFDKKEPTWVNNEQLSPFIPFTIPTRPKMENWNYSFEIGRGTVLWIKKEKDKESYRWGIRKKAS